MRLLKTETISMIENNLIEEAVKKFSDTKEASNYFISSLISSWKSNSELFFDSNDKYLDFIYKFHFIFKSWETDLVKIKKPSQRLIMARFLMKLYHLNNQLEKGIFLKNDSPVEVLHRYYCNRPY